MFDNSGSDLPFYVKFSENNLLVKGFQFMPELTHLHVLNGRYVVFKVREGVVEINT